MKTSASLALALARNHVKNPKYTEKASPRPINHNRSPNKPDLPFQENIGQTIFRQSHSFMKYPG